MVIFMPRVEEAGSLFGLSCFSLAHDFSRRFYFLFSFVRAFPTRRKKMNSPRLDPSPVFLAI